MQPPKDAFSSLPLSQELLSVVEELGYASMTPIQAQALGPLLAGLDVIGQAQTGSGKTVAFSLPILQKMTMEPKHLQALVICPTRELGAQVAREIRKLARKLVGLQVLTLFGGEPARQQAESLYHGAHVAVATPGRLVDLIRRGWIDLQAVKTVVLDEADEMLDLGFEEDVSFILDTVKKRKQTVLFSATFPEKVLELSQRFQNKPQHIIAQETKTATQAIEQIAYDVGDELKINILLRVLQQHPANSTLIFCNQKATVNEIYQKLLECEASCALLHGDLEQRDRNEVMALFRNASYRILIATDVAARGLDIENLELVINYDLPQQTETYIHRIGRTGRAGKTGVAVSLLQPTDGMKIYDIETEMKAKLQRPKLGFKNQHGLSQSHGRSLMQTLVIGGGRKDKLRPGDIVGALTGDGGLKFEDIGKIEIQDHNAYVAISVQSAKTAYQRLRDSKIKGQKFYLKLIGN